MIRPEQRTHVIKVYITKTDKAVLKNEARRRGVSVSALFKVAVFDYLSPKVVPKSVGIVRIDRTPKGSITMTDIKAQRRADDYRGCMVELKQYFAKKKRLDNEL